MHRALVGTILLLSVILALSAAHFGRENQPEKTERTSGMVEISVRNDFKQRDRNSTDSLFVGRWIEISSDNVLAYHKASGVPTIMAVVASKMKLDVEISLVENGFRQITRTLLKNVDATFDFTKPVVLYNPLTMKNDRIRAEGRENSWTLVCSHQENSCEERVYYNLDSAGILEIAAHSDKNCKDGSVVANWKLRRKN